MPDHQEVAMLQTILVPLDGSELAEQALPLALTLAKQTGAAITLLRVIPPPLDPHTAGGITMMAEERLRALWEEADTYLQAVARRLEATTPPPNQPLTLNFFKTLGDPAVPPIIAEYANEVNADLIVLATHGRTGLSRWALGSVAEQLLQLTRRPVLIVRPRLPSVVNFDHLPSLKKIMVPLDGSELARQALPLATELAHRFASDLLLFRAAPLPDVILVSPELSLLQADLWESHKREAQQDLRAEATRLGAEGLRVQMMMTPGPAADTLLGVAEDEGVDLIVMTTHGYTGLRRIIYGSVTNRVIRSSPTPVLVVRPPIETA
jgi:nucleotide-binding universal stress UspA family protein